MSDHRYFKSGYAALSGLHMYYEMYGVGKPLVLIHGGGSTIQTTFGKTIPMLAKNRQVIAMELQAHGRTGDRDKPLSFEQDADDVAQLLNNLEIDKADFLGFSNGGQTLIEMALRHPERINKLIICSAFYNRTAAVPQFWNGFDGATIDQMPQPLKDEFLNVNNDPAALLNMFNRDVERMKGFKDWTDDQIKSIIAPTLIINGTHDVGSPEHALEMHRLIAGSELIILPSSHGEYIGEVNPLLTDSRLPEITVLLIENFLDKKSSEI